MSAIIGKGREDDIQNKTLLELISKISRGKKSLTDGDWVSVVRESLRGWSRRPQEHPLTELVTLFFKNSRANRIIDELLSMRKSETIAHGPAGDEASLKEIISIRLPQLEYLLKCCEPLWQRVQFVVPLSQPMDKEERQRAWSLRGVASRKGRWRRLDLDEGLRLESGQIVLINDQRRVVLHLYPMALFQRPTPETIEEFFVFDGPSKTGSRHISIPAMLEVESEDAWALLEEVFFNKKEENHKCPVVNSAFSNPSLESQYRLTSGK